MIWNLIPISGPIHLTNSSKLRHRKSLNCTVSLPASHFNQETSGKPKIKLLMTNPFQPWNHILFWKRKPWGIDVHHHAFFKTFDFLSYFSPIRGDEQTVVFRGFRTVGGWETVVKCFWKNTGFLVGSGRLEREKFIAGLLGGSGPMTCKWLIAMLGGGFKYFLFSPLFGEDEPILTDIFQRDWNHQLA